MNAQFWYAALFWFEVCMSRVSSLLQQSFSNFSTGSLFHAAAFYLGGFIVACATSPAIPRNSSSKISPQIPLRTYTSEEMTVTTVKVWHRNPLGEKKKVRLYFVAFQKTHQCLLHLNLHQKNSHRAVFLSLCFNNATFFRSLSVSLKHSWIMRVKHSVPNLGRWTVYVHENKLAIRSISIRK